MSSHRKRNWGSDDENQFCQTLQKVHKIISQQKHWPSFLWKMNSADYQFDWLILGTKVRRNGFWLGIHNERVDDHLSAKGKSSPCFVFSHANYSFDHESIKRKKTNWSLKNHSRCLTTRWWHTCTHFFQKSLFPVKLLFNRFWTDWSLVVKKDKLKDDDKLCTSNYCNDDDDDDKNKRRMERGGKGE